MRGQNVATDKYNVSKGWFPVSRNFSVRTHVKVTCLNEIETMYERPRVNVKVKGGSTFTYTRDLPDYRETNDKRNY